MDKLKDLQKPLNVEKEVKTLKKIILNPSSVYGHGLISVNEFDKMIKRIELLEEQLLQRPEKTIAIVGHSSFIGQFKDKKIGDEEHELKHCFPYKFIIDETTEIDTFV